MSPMSRARAQAQLQRSSDRGEETSTSRIPPRARTLTSFDEAVTVEPSAPQTTFQWVSVAPRVVISVVSKVFHFLRASVEDLNPFPCRRGGRGLCSVLWYGPVYPRAKQPSSVSCVRWGAALSDRHPGDVISQSYRQRMTSANGFLAAWRSLVVPVVSKRHQSSPACNQAQN